MGDRYTPVPDRDWGIQVDGGDGACGCEGSRTCSKSRSSIGLRSKFPASKVVVDVDVCVGSCQVVLDVVLQAWRQENGEGDI